MNTTMRACRHGFAAALLESARKDSSIFVISSDSKGSAAIGEFERQLPSQFVEVGIAEQDAVGMAAGLARCGKNVFVSGPASFYSTRSLDQVKVDVAYARSNVKIFGISGGASYGALGSTHHSLHDIAVMRAFPNMSVFLPCDYYSTAALTKYLAEHDLPAYVRIGRNPVNDVYGETIPDFVPGKANVLRNGDDCALIAAGEMVQSAVAASDKLLLRGIRARVLDFWSIKPIDTAAIRAAARETRCIITIEEHSVYGGLGSAVAEIVVQNEPAPMRILGFPDEWAPAGSQEELFAYYKLTADDVAAAAELCLSEKR